MDYGSYVEGTPLVYVETSGWGTICDDGFNNWSAEVACASLGYERTSAKLLFGSDTGAGASYPILMDDVICTGSETYLHQCPRLATGHNCGHQEDVYLRCYKPPITQYLGGSCGATDYTCMACSSCTPGKVSNSPRS